MGLGKILGNFRHGRAKHLQNNPSHGKINFVVVLVRQKWERHEK